MKAILIGATGLVGSLLLQQLLQDPGFTSIKLISRKTAGIQHPRIEEVLIDFNDEPQFSNAVTTADVLFCCIGTTQKKVKGDKAAYRKIDFDIPAKAARFCREKNVGAFILVSAVGAHASSANFYLRLKGETETAVLQQNINAVYIMRPSFITGNREEARPAEILLKPVMRFFSIFLVGSLSKYKSIEASDIAAAMLAAAKKNSKGNFFCGYDEMYALSHPV